MPIRLNLLAETQAEEELRRRDPVKRAIWVGAVVVLLVVLWGGWQQMVIGREKERLASLNVKRSLMETNQYKKLVAEREELRNLERKLEALQRLGELRFLWGNVLNALQQTTVPDVFLTRIRAEQQYLRTEAVPAQTNQQGLVTAPAKPAFVTERIVLTLDAKDVASPPGVTQLNAFREAVAAHPFFQTGLGTNCEIRLVNPSAPERDEQTGRLAVRFSVECRFPERVFR